VETFVFAMGTGFFGENKKGIHNNVVDTQEASSWGKLAS
jgi:hypothetical protein